MLVSAIVTVHDPGKVRREIIFVCAKTRFTLIIRPLH
jgi:hypothetical protein